MRRIIKCGFALILIVLIGSAIKFALSWQHFMNTPLIPSGQSFYYVLKPGTGIRTLAYTLQQADYLKHPQYLIWLARLRGDSSSLKAGEYVFKGEITVWQMLDKIIAGDVVIHHVMIVEGWTYQQIEAALNKAPMLKLTLQGLPATEVTKILRVPENNPEGLFFPATYPYVMGDTDTKILKNAYKLMQGKLQQLWSIRSPSVPYKTPYQALVVASMIEKETALNEEKPLIAGVIINRLRKNMFLQIDPTIIYILKNQFNGRVSFGNLRIESPYNTYKYKGLPPSPIAIPSESSILAAVQPKSTSALYYVSKGDGSHRFSNTYAEHNKAILDYKIHRDVKKEEKFQRPPLQEIVCHEPNYMALRKLRPLLFENINVVCWYMPNSFYFLCSSCQMRQANLPVIKK